ncbi:MAG: hypothetical protein JNG89_17090, partial [Planctomycetaceae bacterium]|nr:hypothetical protein [Planctomycetaceae bacterium]
SAKPFRDCQGYILSAVSEDGLTFIPEPGIRVAPQPDLPHMSLRVLVPSVTRLDDGRWRMYFEARGPADRPTIIASAVSLDQLRWELETGERLQTDGGVGGPRFLTLPEGGGRMFCFRSEYGTGGPAAGSRMGTTIVSAITTDGLNFEWEPSARLRDRESDDDSAGITAAQALPPLTPESEWLLFYSAWQNPPPGRQSPTHPSHDLNAIASGRSADFAAASIASDMSGYRSRIFVARSSDGLHWTKGECVIEGSGYGGAGLDAVHAEDMSLTQIDDARWRMYYAACDARGHWSIASATCASILPRR